MQSLVVWSLSDAVALRIASAHKDLGTVTCCDSLQVQLVFDQAIRDVVTISGCFVETLQACLKMVTQQSIKSSFLDSVFFSVDRSGQILLDIRVHNQTELYALVTVETVRSWISQLELLHVVMEENEKEQKSRGTGCCG